MIRAAKVVVADLSDSRPNVLHEVGYAEALSKSIIQICSTPTKDLPFNVRNNRTISYKLGQTAKLKTRLEAEIKKVI
jgi:nucleoside 2-deoxyribosyltransferase